VPPEEDNDVEMREFLDVPTSASASEGASASSYATSPPSRSNRRVYENAVAGPSRLG
jgi:hypothetical protein